MNLTSFHWSFALAYVQWRGAFEDGAATGGTDVYRSDLLGLRLAGGEL